MTTPCVYTPDAETAAAWAERNGFSFRLAGTGDATRATFSSSPTDYRWAYYGTGSPAAAVHEAMAYAVRDRGFDGEFVEHCGSDICAFCTDMPFPSDGERVQA